MDGYSAAELRKAAKAAKIKYTTKDDIAGQLARAKWTDRGVAELIAPKKISKNKDSCIPVGKMQRACYEKGVFKGIMMWGPIDSAKERNEMFKKATSS